MRWGHSHRHDATRWHVTPRGIRRRRGHTSRRRRQPAADQVSCNDGVVGSQVKIIDNAFQPTTIAADADDTVNWTNNGSVTHTVTFDNGKDCGNAGERRDC